MPPEVKGSGLVTTFLYLLEFYFFEQSHRPLKVLTHRSLKSYLKRRATEAVKRARPFCLRFFRTFLPEAVCLRLREPNLRARRNLEGLYVGFIKKLTDNKKNHSKVKPSASLKFLI